MKISPMNLNPLRLSVALLSLWSVIPQISSTQIMVVDLREIEDDVPTLLAVQVCVGLFNQDETKAGAAYTLWENSDKWWVTEILEPDPLLLRVATPVDEFLSHCLATVAEGRYINYNYNEQRLVVPNLITLASVMHAVPLVAGLQESLITFPQQTAKSLVRGKANSNNRTPLAEFEQVFDAELEFKDFTAYDATKYMFEHYAEQTTTMSIMNPGYDNRIDDDDPNGNKVTGGKKDANGSPLTVNPNLRWADYVVKERLFNFYLPKGCIRLTKEHKLLEKMTHPDNTPWPQPIAVYGYNDVKLGPAYFFESETICVKHHNMGQVASETNNLAFWSRKPAITEPMQQVYKEPIGATQYDSTKTYINLVIGDGDNVAMVKDRNYEWVQKRVSYCANETIPESYRCFPISWSLSPHLPHLAPDWLNWFYEQARATDNDYFILPPSGWTYSYPGMMAPEFQDQFVHKTEEAARLFNTTGTVDWEFLLTWEHAIHKFFPRYAASNNTHKIRGLFPVNVPFNVPVLAFHKHEYYKLIEAPHDSSQKVVLFRPREWRGTSGKSVRVIGSKAQNLTPQQFAEEINGYPKGTVSYIYLTSDDHCDLDSLYTMVPLLEEHVQVVNHEVLIDMALQRG